MKCSRNNLLLGVGLVAVVAALLTVPVWLTKKREKAADIHAEEATGHRVVFNGEISETRPLDSSQTTAHQPASLDLGKLKDFAPYAILKDPAYSLPERTRSIASVLELTGHGETELAEVMRFYASPVLDDATAKERERALRNTLLNEMRERGLGTERVIQDLAHSYRSENLDAGLRDYALQHLAAWVPSLSETSRSIALDTLFDALQVKAGTYAGTALLGLLDLQRRTELIESSRAFDPRKIIKAMIHDPAVDVKNRLTAMALASELEISMPEIAATAKEWTNMAGMPVGAQRAASAYLQFYSKY